MSTGKGEGWFCNPSNGIQIKMLLNGFIFISEILVFFVGNSYDFCHILGVRKNILDNNFVVRKIRKKLVVFTIFPWRRWMAFHVSGCSMEYLLFMPYIPPTHSRIAAPSCRSWQREKHWHVVLTSLKMSTTWPKISLFSQWPSFNRLNTLLKMEVDVNLQNI